MMETFYATQQDDFIACFQYEEDARRFFDEFRERLADFALEVEPSKTGLIRFGSAAPWNCKRDGLRRPQTFDFLGFTHYVHRSRQGYFVVGRRTGPRAGNCSRLPSGSGR